MFQPPALRAPPNPHGIPPMFSDGFLWFSYVFLWFSYGFPTVFWWFFARPDLSQDVPQTSQFGAQDSSR